MAPRPALVALSRYSHAPVQDSPKQDSQPLSRAALTRLRHTPLACRLSVTVNQSSRQSINLARVGTGRQVGRGTVVVRIPFEGWKVQGMRSSDDGYMITRDNGEEIMLFHDDKLTELDEERQVRPTR